MSAYEHPGDAWTQDLGSEELYCDACWWGEMREAFADEDDDGRVRWPPKVRFDYAVPFADSVCAHCGVVAAEQHKDETE